MTVRPLAVQTRMFASNFPKGVPATRVITSVAEDRFQNTPLRPRLPDETSSLKEVNFKGMEVGRSLQS